ncbi:MAG: UbiA prenyltransferase family protein [Desulfobacula sp.]|nr:UbiA prenyltransferase family protein [Desulfobacula sp.]
MGKQQSTISYKEILKLIRPYQWIKNLLLFSPLFFSGHLPDKSFFITLSGVLVFCLVSGIGYIINDWMDKENDAFHPQKKSRPFCAKTISGQHAVVLVSFLILLILLISIFSNFPGSFIIYTVTYLCMTIGYSLFFKSIAILEIFAVALGFVIRILAGGAVSQVAVSSWLFMTVFFIAMMISIAKRVNELKQLGPDTAVLHRKSQHAYSLNYLNSMLWACGSITLVVYSLYSVERGALVVYSILPATYGIFRFIYLTDLGKGSDPIKTLFSDRQLLLTTTIFLLFLTLVIYNSP